MEIEKFPTIWTLHCNLSSSVVEMCCSTNWENGAITHDPSWSHISANFARISPFPPLFFFKEAKFSKSARALEPLEMNPFRGQFLWLHFLDDYLYFLDCRTFQAIVLRMASFYLIFVWVHSLGKGSIEKKTFSFGHCPNKGGGGVYPCPNFLALFLEVHFWSIKRVYFFKNANVLNF